MVSWSRARKDPKPLLKLLVLVVRGVIRMKPKWSSRYVYEISTPIHLAPKHRTGYNYARYTPSSLPPLLWAGKEKEKQGIASASALPVFPINQFTRTY